VRKMFGIETKNTEEMETINTEDKMEEFREK
jgi:hypothetical protein